MTVLVVLHLAYPPLPQRQSRLNGLVRDLDDQGQILWIGHGKTHNAKRHLRIPEFIQKPLCELAAGRGPEEFRFTAERLGTRIERRHFWVMVRRLCAIAGVTRVCTHSLRGLYATLAVETGALSESVAASLGHGSFEVTEKHYAQPSAVGNGKTARVASMLAPEPTERSKPQPDAAAFVQQLSPEQRAQLIALLTQEDGNKTVPN